jgi:hypothetical protein
MWPTRFQGETETLVDEKTMWWVGTESKLQSPSANHTVCVPGGESCSCLKILCVDISEMSPESWLLCRFAPGLESSDHDGGQKRAETVPSRISTLLLYLLYHDLDNINCAMHTGVFTFGFPQHLFDRSSYLGCFCRHPGPHQEPFIV